MALTRICQKGNSALNWAVDDHMDHGRSQEIVNSSNIHYSNTEREKIPIHLLVLVYIQRFFIIYARKMQNSWDFSFFSHLSAKRLAWLVRLFLRQHTPWTENSSLYFSSKMGRSNMREYKGWNTKKPSLRVLALSLFVKWKVDKLSSFWPLSVYHCAVELWYWSMSGISQVLYLTDASFPSWSGER